MSALPVLGPSPVEADILGVLVDQVDRLATDRIDAVRIDRDKQIDPSLITDMADLGLFSLTIPEEYGGAGFGLAAAGEVIAAFSRYDRSVATTLGLHLGLGTRGLVRYGSATLKEQFLPSMAAGDDIAAFAATEAGAGSDLTKVSTTGLADGDDLVVNGSKVFVTNGGLASVFTILASTPGLGGARRGHSLLALRKGDGVQIGAEEDKLGLRGSSTVTVHFDDLRMPDDRVIGTAGAGMAQVEHVLSWGRTAMAAGCIGTTRAALEAATRHVLTRRQFGKTLAQQPVVRQQLADASALMFAMQAIMALTAAREHDDRALAATSLAAKILCSEGSWDVVDLAVQLHGGSGFIEETGIPLMLRDARITRIFEGANDVLASRAGGLLVMSPPERPRLGGLADVLQHRIRERRFELLDHHGVRIVRRPSILHGLGRAWVLAESADAVTLQARAIGTEQALALADRWMKHCEAQLGHHLAERDDDTAAMLSDALYDEVSA
jgi:alkylation response protein AidB-like acyl-CoA dehydrogenase